MHIVDGVLSYPVLLGGTACAVAGIAKGLAVLDQDRMPTAGILSAAFFVASLIHVPLGPSSVHLVMNGLAGLLLGWAAFPVIFVGLLLQAVFFGYGGVTVLGINTLNMALPAVLVYYLCRAAWQHNSGLAVSSAGLAGGLAIVLAALMVAGSLALSGDPLVPAAKLVIVTNLPVMVIEGLLCAATIMLIRKVKPAMLSWPGQITQHA